MDRGVGKAVVAAAVLAVVVDRQVEDTLRVEVRTGDCYACECLSAVQQYQAWQR